MGLGTILRFPKNRRHARASDDEIAAKASKVTPRQRCFAANFTILGHWPGGIAPRARQVLTVLGAKSSAADTSPVPPSPSMIASTSKAMEPVIVRKLRTCQEFASGETTLPMKSGRIDLMGDRVTEIANRLIRTRIALGFESQADFCAQIDVQKHVYNPFEKARRRISLDVALKIRDRFGIPLDWTYCGDASRIPAGLFKKISRAA